MTTKSPSGTGLAAVGSGQASPLSESGSEMGSELDDVIDQIDPIGDILLDVGDKPAPSLIQDRLVKQLHELHRRELLFEFA